jgi:hypothetical protein
MAISGGLKSCTQQIASVKKDFDDKIHILSSVIDKLTRELAAYQHDGSRKKTTSRRDDLLTIDTLDEEITADQLLL